MSCAIVDVESDGPFPVEFSMVYFGAIVFDDQLDQTFYGQIRPGSDRFVPEALAVSGERRDSLLRLSMRHGNSAFSVSGHSPLS
jgi:hypothetical protein